MFVEATQISKPSPPWMTLNMQTVSGLFPATPLQSLYTGKTMEILVTTVVGEGISSTMQLGTLVEQYWGSTSLMAILLGQNTRQTHRQGTK